MIALVTLEPTPFPPGVLRKNAYPLRNFYYNCLRSFSCSVVRARLSGQESEAGTICPIPLPGLRDCRLPVYLLEAKSSHGWKRLFLFQVVVSITW